MLYICVLNLIFRTTLWNIYYERRRSWGHSGETICLRCNREETEPKLQHRICWPQSLPRKYFIYTHLYIIYSIYMWLVIIGYPNFKKCHHLLYLLLSIKTNKLKPTFNPSWISFFSLPSARITTILKSACTFPCRAEYAYIYTCS